MVQRQSEAHNTAVEFEQKNKRVSGLRLRKHTFSSQRSSLNENL
jgi:hypothetical protein